jgi:HD-GYP domain-containing protein (c-di-GMP phosphodiesterase class II)
MRRLRREIHDIVSALCAAIDARDAYTFGHSIRVAEMAYRMGQGLKIPRKELERIHLAAHLHDVGKIGVPDSVLSKPGVLTEDEFALIQLHPVTGEDICRGVKYFKSLLPLIRYHHERFDGRGYPDGLAGEDIPMGARIMAVADSLDAMLSDRPYRPAMTLGDARAEVEEHAGDQFDPDIVKALGDISNYVHGLEFSRGQVKADPCMAHELIRHSLRIYI